MVLKNHPINPTLYTNIMHHVSIRGVFIATKYSFFIRFICVSFFGGDLNLSAKVVNLTVIINLSLCTNLQI
jgi:hypothetical protein